MRDCCACQEEALAAQRAEAWATADKWAAEERAQVQAQADAKLLEAERRVAREDAMGGEGGNQREPARVPLIKIRVRTAQGHEPTQIKCGRAVGRQKSSQIACGSVIGQSRRYVV